MANSRIGAETLTLAKILTDPAVGATTYDTPFAISKKLIKIGVKAKSNIEPQYADDQTVDMFVEDGDITLTISITDLTEDEKALIFGQTMVAGVRTPNPTTDVRPYFCAMWKSKKRNLKYKYYKVLKVMFEEPDEDFETKAEKSKPQTDDITGTGIQRLSDGLRKRIADADSVTWLDATGTDWFTTGDITPDIVAPTIASTLPAAAAVGVAVSATFAWTFSEAILAASVIAGNFFIFADVAGTLVAGTLSQNAAKTVITFTPTANLTATTAYRAVATADVSDLSNNKLAGTDVRKFTTA